MLLVNFFHLALSFSLVTRPCPTVSLACVAGGSFKADLLCAPVPGDRAGELRPGVAVTVTGPGTVTRAVTVSP